MVSVFWYEFGSCFFRVFTHLPLSNLNQCFFKFGTRRQCEVIGFEMLPTSVIFTTAVKLVFFVQIQIVFVLLKEEQPCQFLLTPSIFCCCSHHFSHMEKTMPANRGLFCHGHPVEFAAHWCTSALCGPKYWAASTTGLLYR